MQKTKESQLAYSLRIIRGAWVSILLILAVAIAASIGLTLLLPKVYAANLSFYIATQSDGTNATYAYQGSLLSQQRVKTYTGLITSDRLLQEISSDLQGTVSVAQLRQNVSASAQLDSVLITVTAESTSPEQALDIATAVNRTFPALVTQIEQPPDMSKPPTVIARTIDAPTLAPQPVSPRWSVNMALGLLLGILLGLAYAFGRDLIDQRIRRARDLEDIAPYPLLGEIPSHKYDGQNELSLERPDHLIEAYKKVRTNFQFVDVDQTSKTVLITSSIPSEGKTTVSCSLALALSQAGLRTLMVDADLRKPRGHQPLGLNGDVGITNILAGQATPRDVTQSWSGSFDFIACGALPPNPSELLGSHRMQEFLVWARKEYDVILFDTPPIGPVADASVLASLVDGVILVSRANRVRRDQMAYTIDALEKVNAKVLGFILVDVDRKEIQSKYAYYGNYYSSNHPRSALPEERFEDATTRPSPYPRRMGAGT